MSKRGPIFVISDSEDDSEDYGSSEHSRDHSPSRKSLEESLSQGESLGSQDSGRSASEVDVEEEDIPEPTPARAVGRNRYGANPNVTADEWCYTLNNPTPSHIRRLKRLRVGDSNNTGYHVFQIERGALGTKHCQGYIFFNSRKRFTTVQTLFQTKVGKSPHLEKRLPQSSPAAAAAYCKDPEKRHPDHSDFLFENGVCPERDQPGKRTDLIAIKELLEDGTHPVEISKDGRYFGSLMRYGRAFTKYYDDCAPKRDKLPRVLVLYGDPGTSKTTHTMGLPRAYYAPLGSSGTAWFTDYDPRAHDTVIFNEFHGSQCSLGELLRYVDRVPLSVNTKGGHVNFNPKCVIFTANYDPRNWYKFDDPTAHLSNPFEALDRRMHNIWHYTKEPPNPNATIQGAYAYAYCLRGDATFHPCKNLIPTGVANCFGVPNENMDDEAHHFTF